MSSSGSKSSDRKIKVENNIDISNEYIDFIEKKTRTYDSIFEALQVSNIGITSSDLSYQLDIPEKILLQCFKIIIHSWNTFFTKGRIIYNERDNKYYYLDPEDPRSRERKPKIFVY